MELAAMTDTAPNTVGRRGFARTAAGMVGAVAGAASLLPTVKAQAATGTAQTMTVPSGVAYSLIGTWDAAKLNQILTIEAPRFFGIEVRFTPAKTGVKLYRVVYPSAIPEKGNQPILASGLVAVPDGAGTTFPLLSYQHGTVYGKQEVPSQPDQSPETQLILAQFAGQGYIVIGADYFGMGGSAAEPEGYLVKASQQQAPFDFLRAAEAVLAQLGVSATRRFLGGWSQGGFVTMALLEKLEASGMAVDGTATASCPMDGFAAFSGFIDFPRSIDATWVPTLFILTAFSFENYYGMPGLARAMFADSQYDIARAVYERQPYDLAKVPTKLHDLLRPDYFDPRFFMASAYGRIVAETLQAYRWVIKTPVRNYYGESDEVITPGVGRMAMIYQQAMGSGNTSVTAISTGKTDHRGTFMTAVPQWKTWFDAATRG
jgi:pimeloyl-ACP methyl ester carboxylesterase